MFRFIIIFIYSNPYRRVSLPTNKSYEFSFATQLIIKNNTKFIIHFCWEAHNIRPTPVKNKKISVATTFKFMETELIMRHKTQHYTGDVWMRRVGWIQSNDIFHWRTERTRHWCVWMDLKRPVYWMLKEEKRLPCKAYVFYDHNQILSFSMNTPCQW